MTTKKDVIELYQRVRNQTDQDIRKLRITTKRVHFIEYRAYEPQWQPKVFSMTYDEAVEYFDSILDLVEALCGGLKNE